MVPRGMRWPWVNELLPQIPDGLNQMSPPSDPARRHATPRGYMHTADESLPSGGSESGDGC